MHCGDRGTTIAELAGSLDCRNNRAFKRSVGVADHGGVRKQADKVRWVKPKRSNGAERRRIQIKPIAGNGRVGNGRSSCYNEMAISQGISAECLLGQVGAST